ncbi:MAG: hypothetical protein IJ460_02875 [Clostridia bacterium]|nr:hypothetical protein [Clostridia bacterium]
MKDWKTILKKLLYPPVWLMIILVILSTAALAATFVKGLEESPAAYVIYVLSFYTLTVVCIACADVIPGCYRAIRQKVYDNKFGNRYMTDPAFKTHIGLYRSLAVNLLYAAFNLFSGIYYRSAWFMLFAGYYIIMALMRFLLVRYVNKEGIGRNRFKELKRSRLCALILLTVNLALSGAVLMMVYFDRGFEYYGILIYVMAMYTFYITTAAIINVIKYKKYNSPVMSMAKSVNLAAALISMLALETAMLSQFGSDMSPENRRIMIIATGAGISAIIVCISVYNIWKTSKEIKNM